jgi:DNA-binding response OmpR family regulator
MTSKISSKFFPIIWKKKAIGCTRHKWKRGIEKAKEILPDLILLDVMMPGKDGIETCEELRQIKELQKTLIVFLSARSKNFHNWLGTMQVPMIIS